jgi:DNA-binding PadR family transcriptional regulator
MSVRHALLALLSEGPKYGAQLRQEFEFRTGEVWPLNVGQVYTTLQRLERDGLVEAEDDEPGPQHGYRISDSGRDELARWLRTPPDASAPPRDELVIKVLIALTLPEIDIRDVVQTHRRQLVEAMQQYTKVKSDLVDDDVATALVVDAEIYRLDAMVRWLDTADARLGRVERPVSPAPTAGRRAGLPALQRKAARR